jgi:hypothetical protein
MGGLGQGAPQCILSLLFSSPPKNPPSGKFSDFVFSEPPPRARRKRKSHSPLRRASRGACFNKSTEHLSSVLDSHYPQETPLHFRDKRLSRKYSEKTSLRRENVMMSTVLLYLKKPLSRKGRYLIENVALFLLLALSVLIALLVSVPSEALLSF